MTAPKFVERAREAWNRVLNMDGGQPQATAAGMWASIYADSLFIEIERLTPHYIKPPLNECEYCGRKLA